MCQKCSFREQLNKMDIPYRPDAPLGYGEKHNHCNVVAVGINPGWNDEDYKKNWKEQIYRELDIEKYKAGFISLWEKLKEEKKIGRQPYRDSIANTFDKINEELKIYESKIEKERIFDYVFWANLSFCSSQNVWQRKFDGEEIKCDVFNEEIPNCLNKGYLRRIIEAIEPRLVIFFGYEAAKYIYFTKIFDIKKWDAIVDYPKTLFPAHKRGDKDVKMTIIASKLKANDKEVAVLFLPHPNYRWNSTYKESALKEIRDWLKSS